MDPLTPWFDAIQVCAVLILVFYVIAGICALVNHVEPFPVPRMDEGDVHRPATVLRLVQDDVQ